ncbi:MAG TPA: C40 family peptidase [Gemmatimonadaceae bacterium]|nr:C40 family peptidase [Gemmatimonadaceae bacterium]
MRRSFLGLTLSCSAFLAPAGAFAQAREAADSFAVRENGILVVPAPPRATMQPAPRASAASTMGTRARARIDSVVAMARRQLDARYRLGGESPKGFDCSGLVRYVMSALDLSLPRTAREQARVGTAVPTDTAKLRPGDLVLFGRKGKVTHIGIYVGDGYMVHASTKAKRVVERPLLRRPAPGIVPWIGARRLLAGDDSLPAPLGVRRDSLPNGG